MAHGKYSPNWEDLNNDYDKINYLWNEDMLYDVVLFQDFCPNQYSSGPPNSRVDVRPFTEHLYSPDSLALLIQRYSIQNHPWCDGYTEYIADVLKTKFLMPVADEYDPAIVEEEFVQRVPSRVRKANFFVEYAEGNCNGILLPYMYHTINHVDITIPATNKPEEYIITYLYESSVDSPILHRSSQKLLELKSSLGLDPDNIYIGRLNPLGTGSSFKEKIVLGKHYVKLVTKTVPQKIKLAHLFYHRNHNVINREGIPPIEKSHYNHVYSLFKYPNLINSDPLKNFYVNIAKFSVVVSGPSQNVVNAIETGLPPMSLWKNRDSLKDTVWPHNVGDFPYTIPNYPYDVKDSIWTKDLYKCPLADDVLVELDIMLAWYLAIRVSSTNKTLYDPKVVGKLEWSPWYGAPFWEGGSTSGQYIPSPPSQPPNFSSPPFYSGNLTPPWVPNNLPGSLPTFPSGGGAINWFQDNIHCKKKDFVSTRQDKIGVAIFPAKPFATRLVDTKIPILPVYQYGIYENLNPYDIQGLFLAGSSAPPWTPHLLDDDSYSPYAVLPYESDPRISPDKRPWGEDKETWWWYEHDFSKDTTAMLIAKKEKNFTEFFRLRDTTRMYIHQKPPVRVYRLDTFIPGEFVGSDWEQEDQLDRKESDVFKSVHDITSTLSPIVDRVYEEVYQGAFPLPPSHTVVGNYSSGFTEPAWSTYGGRLAAKTLAIRDGGWWVAYFATNVRLITLWDVERSMLTEIRDHPVLFTEKKLKPIGEFVNSALELDSIDSSFFDWLDIPANSIGGVDAPVTPPRRLGRKGTELLLEEISACLGCDWFNYLTISNNNMKTVPLPRALIQTLSQMGTHVDANGVYIV